MSALTPGRYIAARFRLIHPLVEGEAPDLWLADDVVLGEQVAVAILPPGTPAALIAQLRGAPAAPAFDVHRDSGLSFITIAGADADRQAAAFLDRLRSGAHAPAGRQPEGGVDRPAGVPGAVVTKPQVRLTPPPRVQPIRPITPRLAAAPQERAAPARHQWGLVSGIAAGGALLIAGLVVVLLRNDPPPEGTAVGPAMAPPPVAAPVTRNGDGARQERAGDIAGAERTYNRAVALDPLSEAARDALARVEARLGDDQFSAAISAGLQALDRNEFEAARAAFRRASELRPDSQQAADGLLQAEEGEKLAAITAHRDRAIEMEEAEHWRAAEKEYDAILQLDPAIRIAAEGVERTRARAELTEALAYHLDHPERLAADEVFEEASLLRSRAAAIAPAGPRLRGQVEALDALLARMRGAVRVILESDERTEVSIYRVGRLGTFSRREVELRPGTYTVIGTRRGYRDVRRQLVIAPGKQPGILVVRCEEKI